MTSAHFKGKDALEHVAEKQAQGKLFSSEMHGSETPGKFSAACDATREMALLLLILAPFIQSLPTLLLIVIGWSLWKIGRSAWLGWFRLERLHRVLAQEKWEIEHHREQEREELVMLYSAKGFEGQLLEDVVDVLMADGDRLLRVMVEEELGLSLHQIEHPLEQSLGAAIGSTLAALVCIAALFSYGTWGLMFGAFFSIGLSALISAYLAGNRPIPTLAWNLGIAILAFGCVHFLRPYFL